MARVTPGGEAWGEIPKGGVLMNVSQAITAGTPFTVWTPTAGKSFRLKGFHLALSVGGGLLWKYGAANTLLARTPTLAANVASRQYLGWGHRALADYPEAVLSDSPIGYYRLGERSGTTAADLGSGANPGTYVNTPALGAPGLLPGPGEGGDTAVLFNGTTQAMTVPAATELNLADAVSVEAWIKPTSLADDEVIYESYQSTAVDVGGYGLHVMANGRLKFVIRGNNTHIDLFSTVGALVAGNAYYVAATYKANGEWDIWINGQLNASGLDTNSGNGLDARVTTTEVIGIARRTAGPALWFDGVIDEVAIYGAALSPTRVAAHYSPPRSGAPLKLDVTATGTVTGYLYGDED